MGTNEHDETPQPKILGSYEVKEPIGHGGMAVVYRGVQTSLNRQVAIKILPERMARSSELHARFEREATIVAQLNHPNIVQVIDRGRDGDTLYIVMEYVDGDSLDVILRKTTLSPAQILDIAMQVCEGLIYAHSTGVVHRDLKPSNILIERRSSRAKIADFGIAQLETSTQAMATVTSDNTAIGTMNYMSPEQRLDAHRVTHLTDIFSFGVILYEMATGKLPIGHFKQPSLIRNDIPMGLDAIVRKCLAESPRDRYQDAGEVQRDLRQLTAHYGRIGTPAINSLIHRLSSRQRSIAIGVAVTGAVLLIAGIAALMLSDRPGKRTGQEQTTAQQQQTAASTDTSTQAQISASPPQPQIAAPAQKNTTQPAPPDKPPAKQPEKQPAAAPNQTETDAPTASGTQPQPDNAPADTARAEQAPRLTTEPENQPETDTAPAEPKQDPQALRIAADFARASGLISRGEQEEAIPILRTIVTDHPKSPMAPEAQFALATAYRDSGDLEKAKLEFDRLLRTYPDSPRTAEALVGKVRAEWKTAPKIGLLRNAWDAELQKRLIQELAGALENLEETARVPALALVAEIAEAPELEDLPLAADMLVQQYALDPNPDADVIYRAGRIYDRKLDQVDKAVACYELFVKDFPQDPRMGRIKLRIKDLLDLPRN